MSGIDIEGTDVLNEMFDDVIDETPEADIAAEETPAVEITVSEEAPPEKPETEEISEDKPEGDVVEDTVPEGYVPIPVHAELRAKARDKEELLRHQLSEAQIAKARAEARAEILEQMAEKASLAPKTPLPPPEKSPLEKFEEEYPGEAVTAKVLLEQQTFDRAQANKVQEQTIIQTRQQEVDEGIRIARETYSAEKMGSPDLTLDSVVALARHHGLLTEDDVANLAPYGKRAGTILYNTAISSIKQAGGIPLAELNTRVVAARQSLANKNDKPTKPKPVVKPVVPAVPAGVQSKAEDSDDDADIGELTNFMFA